MAPAPLRVGLTGGIACGKSVVLGQLAAAGLRTLDLDRVAHELMAPGGAAYADVVAGFGTGILAPDGAIDRRALGEVVFRDEGARRRLNAIVHPRVREEEARRVDRWGGAPGTVVVTDAALLVETGQHLRFDRLVVVHCPPEVQLRRLMTRDGISEEAARSRLIAQLPISEKRRFGHLEVDTSGSLAETRAQADELARSLRRVAAEPRMVCSLDRARVVGCLQHGASRGPRGLDPLRVARTIGQAPALEMEELAALLRPPASSPWYWAARPDEGPPQPAVLAGLLALWTLTRGKADEEFLLAAAASLARLTHSSAEAIGTSCVLALASRTAALGIRTPRSLLGMLESWRLRARRWAGGPFPDMLQPVLRAAMLHPDDVGRARQACAESGGDPDLVGGLVGLDARSPGVPEPADVVAVAEALLSPAEGSSALGS